MKNIGPLKSITNIYSKLSNFGKILIFIALLLIIVVFFKSIEIPGLNKEGFQSQDLTPLDKQLVTSNFINSQFGAAEDYLELYIYDENNNLLDVDYDAFDYYPYLTANPKNNTYSSLTLDPEKDLKNRGYNRGNLNIDLKRFIHNLTLRLSSSDKHSQAWVKSFSNKNCIEVSNFYIWFFKKLNFLKKIPSRYLKKFPITDSINSCPNVFEASLIIHNFRKRTMLYKLMFYLWMKIGAACGLKK
jgi:hypothetical protein